MVRALLLSAPSKDEWEGVNRKEEAFMGAPPPMVTGLTHVCGLRDGWTAPFIVSNLPQIPIFEPQLNQVKDLWPAGPHYGYATRGCCMISTN
jgi:hypothetical protein